MDYKELAKYYYTVVHELKKACLERVSELMKGKEYVALTSDELHECDLDPICVTVDMGLELVCGIRPNGYGDDFIIETEGGDTYLSHLEAGECLGICELLDDYLSGVELTDETRLERMEERYS